MHKVFKQYELYSTWYILNMVTITMALRPSVIFTCLLDLWYALYITIICVLNLMVIKSFNVWLRKHNFFQDKYPSMIHLFFFSFVRQVKSYMISYESSLYGARMKYKMSFLSEVLKINLFFLFNLHGCKSLHR